MKDIDISKITERLLGSRKNFPKKNLVEEYEVQYLISKSVNLFLCDAMLLEINPPVCILGDIRGQLSDLLRYFEKDGYPSTKKYLFLGNYFDKGEDSIDMMCLLMCYKIEYPQNIFLLRGNLESKDLSKEYGLFDNCKRMSGAWIWRKFLELFNSLPVAAIVDTNIFCVHGGLSPNMESLDEIKQISRPTEVPSSGLLCDLLWSEPSHSVEFWGPSEHGVSFTFGARQVEMFLAMFNFDLIIRSSRVGLAGGALFFTNNLVSLFSATNSGGQSNCGAALTVNTDGVIALRVLPQVNQKIVE